MKGCISRCRDLACSVSAKSVRKPKERKTSYKTAIMFAATKSHIIFVRSQPFG